MSNEVEKLARAYTDYTGAIATHNYILIGVMVSARALKITDEVQARIRSIKKQQTLDA